MPRSRYRILHQQTPHFLTATVNHWLPLLTRPETVEIVLDSWWYLQGEADFIRNIDVTPVRGTISGWRA